MRQVFDSLFEQSTYHFRRLPALSPVAGGVLDKADSHLLLMLLPTRLESSRVGFFIKKVQIHLRKYIL